jgi:hypothetical protein
MTEVNQNGLVMYCGDPLVHCKQEARKALLDDSKQL